MIKGTVATLKSTVNLQLYVGHQIKAKEQVHTLDYLPLDEALQEILYELGDDYPSEKSGDSEQ